MTGPDSHLLPLTAVVLAGGRSERMGSDKTVLEVGGKPLVARVVEAVGEVCERTLVVTNRPDAISQAGLPAGVAILTDEVAYQGPLGGIVTALAETRTEWMLVAAADMPHLEPAVIRELWAHREGADAVVPVSEKGLEPLLALYRVEPCLPAARAVLAEGKRRPDQIFPRVRTVQLPAEKLRRVDPELRSFANVNTPVDLERARFETGSGELR